MTRHDHGRQNIRLQLPRLLEVAAEGSFHPSATEANSQLDLEPYGHYGVVAKDDTNNMIMTQFDKTF